ncbi:MAG: hypothetical protein EHM68_16265 [Lysobacterales bacterium]|nr:MAG: hypothetical protein EHM68_16265 [Xanthomonadales bacterium]
MTKTTLTLLLLGHLAFAASASAVQLFDFDAQAVMPAGTGSAAVVYGRIVNGSAVATPLPLDFANYEYTIVVTGLVQDTAGATSLFSGGAVAIHQDAATSADWATPSSFSDGTVILSGTLAAFQRTMLTATLGSGAGAVDWTGGTMLNLLAPADQTGWPFLTSVSRAASQVQPGYSERWDGKVEPREEVVSTERRSWSELKAGYR